MTAQKDASSKYSRRWLLFFALSVFAVVGVLLWRGEVPSLLAAFGLALLLAYGQPLKKYRKIIYRGILPFGIVTAAVTWFLNPRLTKVVWIGDKSVPLSLLIGVAAGALAVYLVIEVWARARLHWLTIFDPDLDQPEARRFLRSEAFGLNYPVFIADGSQARVSLEGGPGGFLQRAGGPGMLVAKHGCAVVLERGGDFTRVAKGVKLLALFEAPKAVVDLRQQRRKLSIQDVLTLDGASVGVEMSIWYQIKRQATPAAAAAAAPPAGNGQGNGAGKNRNGAGEPPQDMEAEPPGEHDDLIDQARPHEPQPRDEFGVDDRDILRAVYQVADWQASVLAMAEHILRDVVGERTLDELLGRDAARNVLGRVAVRNIVKGRLEQWLENERWGVEVGWIDVGNITVPEAARQRMLERWLATLDVKIAETQREAVITRGEAEAAAASAQEAVRARASMQLITTILDAMENAGMDRDQAMERVVNLRMIDALEKMATEHFSGFLPAGLLEGLTGQGRPNKADDNK